MRDFNLPKELHHSINSVENFNALNPDFDNEPAGQSETKLESYSPTITMNQEPSETGSDEYDIEMGISAKSLGASVYTLADCTSCQVCNFDWGRGTVL